MPEHGHSKCGTTAGYAHHWDFAEPIDDACREAKSRYNREYWATLRRLYPGLSANQIRMRIRRIA